MSQVIFFENLQYYLYLSQLVTACWLIQKAGLFLLYKYRVELNNKMTRSMHADYVVSRHNRQLGFNISVAKHLSSDTLMCLQESLVLPLIEYGQPAWFIHSQGHIGKVKKIRRRATCTYTQTRKTSHGVTGAPSKLEKLSFDQFCS